MGLFSKEACALCGKEVGMLSRAKLESKEYICNDCLKGGHEFLRPDYCTLDEFKQIVEQVPQAEAAFDEVTKGTTTFTVSRQPRLIEFYSTGSQTGEFAFRTNETKRFGHKYIFSFYKMGPYKFSSMPQFDDPKQLNPNDRFATLEEIKSNDKVTGYTLCFPYNDKSIRNVRLKMEAVSQKDAQKTADWLNNVRSSILKSDAQEARDKMELQKKNAYATANAALKAALKGEDVQQAIADGAQRMNDIEEGKIKKKSLFDRLRGKKDLDR